MRMLFNDAPRQGLPSSSDGISGDRAAGRTADTRAWCRPSRATRNAVGHKAGAAILGVLAVGVSLLGSAPTVPAGPGPCIEDPAGVVTCTGNQSSGIASGIDFASPPITTLKVNSLSGDIAPGNERAGVSLINTSGSSVTVESGTPEDRVVITTQGKDGPGIVAVSEGAPTGYDWLPGLGLFVPVGTSGSGGPVAVDSHTNITTNGTGSHGIVAQNRIGTYHPWSTFTLATFSTNDVGVSLVSVAGSGTNIGQAIAGDKGGLITLKADGTWFFDPGMLAGTLQAGESVVTKVGYQVQIAHDPGMSPFFPFYSYGTQVADGSIAFKVTKKSDGSIETVPAIYFGQFDAFSDPAGTTPLWPDLQGYVNRLLADMGIAGAGESILITNAGKITTTGPSSHGITARTEGGTGSTGSSGTFWDSGKIPDPGGPGSNGGGVKIVDVGEIQTHEALSAGIAVLSQGGTGGKGGDGGPWRYGRQGGTGGTGGAITIEGGGVIHTRGDYASGILALSAGGPGGTGGSGEASTGGGSGGFGGKGGSVSVDGAWAITTEGDKAHGVWAKSLGGSAGPGGSGGWLFGKPGSGGEASDGGSVTVTSRGQIETRGADSYGVYAQSVGGFGGTGGTTFGLFWSFGGDGGSAGGGGAVTVTNAAGASVMTGIPPTEGGPTGGARSHAIFAQSVGGGGGGGGGEFGLIASLGGEGGAGGNGGAVEVTNAGLLQTAGDNARGIYAQSVGGGGGDGGNSSGLVSIGGKGSETSDGGTVAVTNSGTIETQGYRSHAIFAESVGGGGGDGGDSGGIITIGGSGGGGGDGAAVTVTNSGAVTTAGSEASGIFAQSVGGGGGNGGGAVSVGAGLSLAIGGNASQGGSGAKVEVTGTSSSSIRTAGDRAYGIFAQSVGGGGGNGGFAVTANVGGGIGLAIGGTGGKGGDGGDVEVHASGTIDTGSVSPSGEVTGKEAHGIFAQSVGGGGGTGGFTVQGSLGGGPSFKLGLGGKGGVGGIGKTVSVGTEDDPIRASISTVGERAYGILAQSLGGGGGDGGFSVTGSVAGGVTLDLAIGGDGGNGNAGGVVHLHSAGDVTTTGDSAHAVFAQSLGGSGGNGGFSVAGSYGGGAGLKLSFGGSGGTGAAGDSVNVGTEDHPLLGSISTTGRRAYGIFAQSVGGGGGNGGSTITGQLLGAQTLQLSFGGNGGAGGAGGDVNLYNAATITTRGEEGFGILAQSVGGGGGNGGMSLAAAVTAFGGLNFSMGGNGGNGNSGGTVDVWNGGTLETFADYAHGIVAQSVGGGGGTGGMAGSATVNFSSLLPIPPQIPIKGSANYAISVGGEGGTGGQAGTVNVSNAGTILTHEDYAYGIFAQSVGGGGGAGGRSIAATGNISLPESPEGGESKPQLEVQLDFALAIGGKGGNGNAGGIVDVVNSGSIDTTGVGSHGIVAQSVGGGGGEGGNARALTVSIDPSNWSPNGSPPSLSVSKAVNIGVGGSAGGGSDGGVVTVDNTGGVTTRGADAHGIFAQSIGGGGGNGGSGYHGLDWADLGVPENLVPYFEFLPVKSEGDLQIVAGGSGGSSGSGHDVTVKSQGRIVTLGDGSFGILAQSIGAGGGTAGIGAVGEEGTVGIGGGGGAAGDGGAVLVEVTGDVETSGKAAHGLFAQSVGGGGGIAGNVDRGVESFGTNLAIGQDGGSAGDGGTVTVRSTGNIITRGSGAYGIFAQSVGGGGGLAGDVGPGIGFAGSVGGDGSAGDVEITHTGNITTLGDNAHGLFAQSVGGQRDLVLQQTVTLLPDGTLKKDDEGNIVFGAPVQLADRFDGGGPITVTVNGDIAAYGRNAHGILAQSHGADANGNISITILGGTVQGGGESGAGVYVADGAANTLTNRGTITTVDGIAGTAVRATGGNDTIENFGTITGSVALGAGRNAFNNNAGATFNIGTADLGLGNALANAGTLSPGGRGVAMTSGLTGNLIQSRLGVLEVEVYKNGDHDKLFVGGGSAALDGTLLILRGPGPYRNGTAYEVLEASGGLGGTFGDIHPPDPRPLLRFDVTQSANTVDVQVSAPSFTTAATNPVYQRIATHLDSLLPSASGDLAVVLGEFQGLPASQIDRAFASMGPMPYDSLTQATFRSTRLYTQSLQRRLDTVRVLQRTAGLAAPVAPVLLAATETDTTLVPILGTYRLSQTQSKHGLWLSGFGQWGDQESTPGYTGFTASTGGVTLGYDYTFGDHLAVGLSVGYADTDVDQAEGQGGGRIQGLFPSVYASYFTRTAYVEGALSYGHNWYKNARNLVIGGIQRTAQSEHDGDAFAAYLGAGYAHPVGNWAVGPVGALQYVFLAEEGFQEAGAGSVNLSVAARDTNSLTSELGLRATGTITTSAGTLIPDISLLWSYDFDVDDRLVTTTYAGAPGAAFSIDGQPVAKNGLLVRPGLTFVHPSGWSTMLRYVGEFRDDYQSHAVLGEVRIQF